MVASSSTHSSGSASPSVSRSVEVHSKLCQVCGQKAHGVHFGAVTCRACAAFFRRVAAEPLTETKCRKSGGVCNFKLGGLAWCKKCRLKKCKDIGMNIENFQFNRDRLGEMKRVTPSMILSLGVPRFTFTHRSSSKSTFIDLKDLLKKTTSILNKARKIPFATGQNRLKKLSMGINWDQSQKIQFVRDVGLNEAIILFESDALAVSKWLTYFDEFSELSEEVKITFMKAIWHVWNRLERMNRTATYMKRQEDPIDRPPLFLTNDCLLDLNNMNLKLEWLTDYSVEEVGYYIECIGDLSLFNCLQPLLDLNPDEVELNYMLAQISFSYAARELDKSYSDIAEKFLQLFADDLHNYYTNEKNITMYSKRVVKMMKVNNTIMEVLWKRRDRLAIARTFNVFKTTFSDPEMFKDIF